MRAALLAMFLRILYGGNARRYDDMPDPFEIERPDNKPEQRTQR